MHSPAMRRPPAAALEAHAILTRDLQRAAAQGKLRVAPEVAAQMVMSANVGVALMLVARPATFTDRAVSRRVRDAVYAAILTPDVSAPGTGDGHATGAGPVDVPAAATRLSTLLLASPSPALTAAEGALLGEWLDRVSNADGQEGPASE